MGRNFEFLIGNVSWLFQKICRRLHSWDPSPPHVCKCLQLGTPSPPKSCGRPLWMAPYPMESPKRSHHLSILSCSLGHKIIVLWIQFEYVFLRHMADLIVSHLVKVWTIYEGLDLCTKPIFLSICTWFLTLSSLKFKLENFKNQEQIDKGNTHS